MRESSREEVHQSPAPRVCWRRRMLTVFACTLTAAAVFAGVGCSGAASEQNDMATTGEEATGGIEEHSDDFWAAYLPKVVTLEDGTQVQDTPYGNNSRPAGLGYLYPYSETSGLENEWDLYNTYVLNADNRGCSSCHDLVDALETNMHHPDMYVGHYPANSIRFNTYSTCMTCHLTDELSDFGHAHLQFDAFKEMGGDCMSCHYIDGEGNYLMWDDVKYDVMKGITPLAIDEVDADIAWNQDETTDPDYYFTQYDFEDGEYDHNVVEHSDDIRDTYTVTFTSKSGEVTEMTINEMIDKYGTETRLLVNHCIDEGAGESLIHQASVTGVPVKAIVEDLQLSDDDTDRLPIIACDGFSHCVSAENFKHGLLVFEMNGEELPDDQGYPLALWIGQGRGAGQNVRFISEVYCMTYEEAEAQGYFAATFGIPDLGYKGSIIVTPDVGEPINTPNIGVLNTPSGTIFKAGEPVHLEGFSHAFVEPVTKVEFSFDGGETWKEVPIDNMDVERWVYWKMDVNGLEPGAYTMQMRATSIDEITGEPHSNYYQPKFLINVQ